MNFAQISTHCRLTVSFEVPLSQQRTSVHQISEFFWRGHDSIPHSHRARCLAVVRHIFNECCHWCVQGGVNQVGVSSGKLCQLHDTEAAQPRFLDDRSQLGGVVALRTVGGRTKVVDAVNII